ncbi:hypothetical protein MD484_g400, partial [Candolleomyces efflorescens]
MSSHSAEEFPPTQLPPSGETPPRPRPRPRKAAGSAKPAQKASRTSASSIKPYLTPAGSSQKSHLSTSSPVIVVSSGSEGEGPTPMDKDDSMYRGKLDRNRVDHTSSKSIIQTRSAAKASASRTTVEPPQAQVGGPPAVDHRPKSSVSSSGRKAVVKSADVVDDSVSDNDVDLTDVVVVPRTSSSTVSQVSASTNSARPASSKAGGLDQRRARAHAAAAQTSGLAPAVHLFSPPVTPTPFTSKRSSSPDRDDSDAASEGISRRRPKRVRLARGQRDDPSGYDSEHEMVVVKEEEVVATFDIEHSASDGEGAEYTDDDDENNSFIQVDEQAAPLDKGKRRASLSPERDEPPLEAEVDSNNEVVSFAQALGLPEEPEGADDAANDGDQDTYCLVLEDSQLYRLNFLPQYCEVTDKSLWDRVLRKYYTNLPPLRKASLTAYSDVPGDGYVAFSDWGKTCPTMTFMSCLNAIEFRSHGRYINPCRISPLDCYVKHLPGSFEKYHLHASDRRHAICLTPVRSRESYLFTPSPRSGRKMLSGVLHSQEMERYVGFLGTVFVREELEAQIYQEALQFSTRPPPPSSPSSSTARPHSSPSVKLRANSSRNSSKDAFSLSATDDVPVYDCRSRLVDFTKVLDDLHSLPLWRQEIPSGSFVVVAHTAAIYKTAGGGWSLSLNILWAMIIGVPVRKVIRGGSD